nr:hypothetical protein [Serratia fonticola]
MRRYQLQLFAHVFAHHVHGLMAAVTCLFFCRQANDDFLAWQVGWQTRAAFLSSALLGSVIVRLEGLGVGGLRLTGVIVAGSVDVTGHLGFNFDLVEHLALRRVRLGAATEALASVQVEFFQLRLQFLL